MPLNATASDAGLLVVKVSVELVAPVDVGEKVTWNVTLAPAFTVAGNVGVNTENAPPLIVAALMVPAAVPVFDTVTVEVAEEPIATCPKLNDDADTAKFAVGVGGGVAPEPLNAIASVAGFVVAIVSVALAVPVTVGENFNCRVTLEPAFTLIGNVVAATLNALPLTVAELIVPVAVPVFETVTVEVDADPTDTCPKLSDDAETTKFAVGAGGGVTPDPLNATVNVAGFVVDIVKLPLAVPATVGAKFTCSVTLAPALTLTGNIVAMLKPLPLTVAALIAPAALPVLKTVTVEVDADPTDICPKLSDEADTVKFATAAGCGVPALIAVPASATLNDAELLPLMVSEPVAVPAALGAKLTLMVALPPAGTVIGKVVAASENPAPATTAASMVPFAVPEFVIVTDCVALAPTVNCPKLIDVAELAS